MASKANSEPENGFFQQVYDIVAQIPKGQALSYGQIAQMLGRPRAARMVGWAMRRCPEELPWHRVVKADGSIAGGGQSELRGNAAVLHAEFQIHHLAQPPAVLHVDHLFGAKL